MLLDDLGSYLVARGVGTLGSDLFLGSLPETDDTAVLALVESPGEPSDGTFANQVVEHPRFQVVGRARDYESARNKIQLAYRALDGAGDETGVPAYYIEALQPPFRLGEDERLRPLIVCNMRAVRKHPNATV